MPSQLSLSYRDYSREDAVTNGNIPLVTAGNFAATATKINTLVLAAANILLGVLHKRTLSIIFAGDGSTPSMEVAQRESKWVVHYNDTSATLAAGVNNPYYGRNFPVSIGVAAYTGHMSPNSDLADLANADISDFKDAFEGLARSPSGGAVVVTRITGRGRNI